MFDEAVICLFFPLLFSSFSFFALFLFVFFQKNLF